MDPDYQQPIFVSPQAGKEFEFLSVKHKLTGQQTGGAYYLFESIFEPGSGNRLHVHSREEEVAYVLEGALKIRLVDQTLIIKAGSVAHLPKNIPHAISNPLEKPSRYLFWPSQPVSINGSRHWIMPGRKGLWMMNRTAASHWIMELNFWSNGIRRFPWFDGLNSFEIQCQLRDDPIPT